MKLEQLYVDIIVEGNFMKSLPLIAAGAIGAYGLNSVKIHGTQNATKQTKSSEVVADKELYEFISHWEGKRSKAYLDTRGIPTVGVGFNLQRLDAKRLLKEIGADYDKVLNGTQELTDGQIDYLLKFTVNGAKDIAHKLIPKLDNMHPDIQKIVIDMAFQLGPTRLSEFKKFLMAINNFDYQAAANELVNSKWYKQSGRRSKHHVEKISFFVTK